MDKSEVLIEETKEITLSIIENLSDEQKQETEIVQDEIRRGTPPVFLETDATDTAGLPSRHAGLIMAVGLSAHRRYRCAFR